MSDTQPTIDLEGTLVDAGGHLCLRRNNCVYLIEDLALDHGLGHIVGVGDVISVTCESGRLVVRDAQGNDLYRGEGNIRKITPARVEKSEANEREYEIDYPYTD